MQKNKKIHEAIQLYVYAKCESFSYPWLLRLSFIIFFIYGSQWLNLSTWIIDKERSTWEKYI